jgi:membrane protein required for colicin V production
MIIDIIAILIIVMAIFKGLRDGLVVAIFSLLAYIIGLTLAVKFSDVVATWLGGNINVSERWLPILAFALVFIVVVLLVRLGAKAIEGVLKIAMLGWLNRIGGVLLYMLLYIFILSVILFYAEKGNMIKPETIEASVTYEHIKPVGPAVMDALGTVIPAFKDMLEDKDR